MYTLGGDSDASFTINPTTGYIMVNDDNDVETQVTGTLTVGRTLGSGSVKQNFSFDLLDGAAPTIESISYSPTADVLGVGDTITISVTFNELVTFYGENVMGQSSLRLNNGAVATLVAIPNGTSETVDFTYTVGEFESVAELEVEVAALELGTDTVVRDTVNNTAALSTLVFPSAGATGSLSDFDSVRVDTSAPGILSYGPSPGATDVSPATNLSLQFNETVTAVAGKNITIMEGSNPFETIDVSSDLVSVSGVDVNINPNTTLTGGVTYTVLIEEGAFLDSVGNPTAAIIDTEWSFTAFTADETPPAVVESSPVDNATEVALNREFLLNFDEAVFGGSGDISVRDTGTGSVVDTASPGFSGTQVTFTFDNLENNKSYYIFIDSGVIKDASENAYAGISDTAIWNFRTPDTIAPTLQSHTPLDNATGVAIDANLVLSFDEAVDAETGNIVIKQMSDESTIESISVSGGQVSGSGTSNITVNPSVTLDAGTEYYIEIADTAFDDVVGNSYAGISGSTDWNFTTLAADAEENPGASGGGGGARATYGNKPQEPDLEIDEVTSHSIRIKGAHTGTAEDRTNIFGYTYKGSTGGIKTVVLDRNVDDKVSFTETIDGLTCETTYLVRVFAKNRAGTSADALRVTTAACDGSTDGVVEVVDEDEVSVEVAETASVPTETYGAVQSVVCNIFTIPTAPGESNADVSRIKLFLSLIFPGLALDLTSSVYDDATVSAVKQFQTNYTDAILKPLGLSQATGFWYQATMKQAHRVLGCE